MDLEHQSLPLSVYMYTAQTSAPSTEKLEPKPCANARRVLVTLT